MLSAKQGNSWNHCLLYDTVLDWGLNPGPPTLEARTLTLGYRGKKAEGTLTVRYNGFVDFKMCFLG